MELLILFGAALIANAVWFAIARRRNRRIARLNANLKTWVSSR